MLCIKTLSSSQLLLQLWSIKLMVATNCNNGFSKSYNNLSFSNKGMHPCSLVKHNTNQWSFLILKCTTGASIASICYFIDWILYMTVLGLDIVEHPIWLNINPFMPVVDRNSIYFPILFSDYFDEFFFSTCAC